MGIIWIVESPKNGVGDIAQKLIGNFPVRVFSSLNSLNLILKINKSERPKVLMVDLAVYAEKTKKQFQLLENQFEGTSIFFVGKSDERAENRLDPNQFIQDDVPAIALARIISSNIRSGAQAKNSTFSIPFGNFEILLGQQCLKCKISNEKIELTSKEVKILAALAKEPGRTISKNELQKSGWQGRRVSDRTVDSQISRLRKTINPFGIEIANIYGDGYLLRE